MSKRELNDWAVMNLSMEDRGEQPQEPDVGHGPTQRNGPERFLSGNLSYFGVGPSYVRARCPFMPLLTQVDW